MQQNDAAAIRPYLERCAVRAGVAASIAPDEDAAPARFVGKPQRARGARRQRGLRCLGAARANAFRPRISRQDARRRESRRRGRGRGSAPRRALDLRAGRRCAHAGERRRDRGVLPGVRGGTAPEPRRHLRALPRQRHERHRGLGRRPTSRRRPSSAMRPNRRSRSPRRASPKASRALRAADPGFDPDAFRGRVKTAFLALQDAWCKQNLDAGRAFLSPGAYFTWRAQLETMAAEGRRNVMENLAVQRDRPDAHRARPGVRRSDRAHHRVRARISKSTRTTRSCSAIARVRPFTEDWTFQRSVGVATTQEARHPGERLPQLRRAGVAHPDRRMPLLQGGRDQRQVRLGGIAHRAGRRRLGRQIRRTTSAADIALRVGGAIVGGLLGSILSGRSSDD